MRHSLDHRCTVYKCTIIPLVREHPKGIEILFLHILRIPSRFGILYKHTREIWSIRKYVHVTRRSQIREMTLFRLSNQMDGSKILSRPEAKPYEGIKGLRFRDLYCFRV